MKVAVIGATGRTGRLVINEARRQGHEVIACTRRPGPLADADELTTVVEGDASDHATLRRGLAGAEAVISTVPGGNRAHPHAAEEVTTAIVSAMREYDVARLVVTSAYAFLVGLLESPGAVRNAMNVTTADRA